MAGVLLLSRSDSAIWDGVWGARPYCKGPVRGGEAPLATNPVGARIIKRWMT